MVLRFQGVSERLLRERAQRMILRGAAEECLQIFLRTGPVAGLQLVEPDLGGCCPRRSRATVIRPHLLQRGDHRLFPLFLGRERLLAWLGGCVTGDGPRLQLERLRELSAGLGLARGSPGRHSPGDQHDRDHRSGRAQHGPAVRDHPAHRPPGDDLEFVRSLQLLAIDLLGHSSASCRPCACSSRFCSHSRQGPRR